MKYLRNQNKLLTQNRKLRLYPLKTCLEPEGPSVPVSPVLLLTQYYLGPCLNNISTKLVHLKS